MSGFSSNKYKKYSDAERRRSDSEDEWQHDSEDERQHEDEEDRLSHITLKTPENSEYEDDSGDDADSEEEQQNSYYTDDEKEPKEQQLAVNVQGSRRQEFDRWSDFADSDVDSNVGSDAEENKSNDEFGGEEFENTVNGNLSGSEAALDENYRLIYELVMVYFMSINSLGISDSEARDLVVGPLNESQQSKFNALVYRLEDKSTDEQAEVLQEKIDNTEVSGLPRSISVEDFFNNHSRLSGSLSMETLAVYNGLVAQIDNLSLGEESEVENTDKSSSEKGESEVENTDEERDPDTSFDASNIAAIRLGIELSSDPSGDDGIHGNGTIHRKEH